jgi:hypothetical protein
VAQDEDLDLLKAIRITAFRAVQEQDSDYLLRFIFRWYSREFHTELSKVEEIPLETVLEHFFECRYESMSDEDKETEMAKLIETRADRLARETKEREEKDSDEAFLHETMAEAAAQGATTQKPAGIDLDKMPAPEQRPLLIPAPVMGEVIPTQFAEITANADPNLKVVPPEIKMEFISEEEMEGMESWDLLGPTTKPKK